MKELINNLHPLSKLSFTFLIILLCTWFQTKNVYIFSVTLLFIVFLFIPKQKEFLKKIIITNVILFLPMFLLQLFFKPGENIIFSWFIFKITKESFHYSINLFIRLSLVSTSILLFFHITKPKHLMISLEKIGVPKTITYIFLSTIMLIPQTIRQSKTIMEAQKVRGINTEGNIIIRFKAFLPMIMPLILSSLMTIEERALTLEARGSFSTNEKSYLYNKNLSIIDKIIFIFCIVIIILFIIGRMIIR